MISYLLFNVFWVYILYRFNAFFFGSDYIDRSRLVASYLFFYTMNSSIHLIFHHPILNLITSLGGLFLIALNYRANMPKRLLSVALIYIVSMLCDIATAVALSRYYPGMRLKAEAIAIGYLMLFIVELILERIFNLRRIQRLNYAHWFALMGVPISSIAIICVLIMSGSPSKKITLVVILLLLLINIFIFYLYDSIQNVYLKELKQSYMEKQLEAYALQMDVMVKSQERINSIQHDLKHHMNTIGALIRAEQYNDVILYLQNMEEYIKASACCRYSTHHTIDSILNYMLNDVRSHFTCLNVNIQVPEDIGMNNFDISIVLGNLLANAIRAAMASPEKYLKLHMNLDKGILFMTAENSYVGKLLTKNGNLVSTKSDDTDGVHGLGLSNIRNIVEKYNGQMEVAYTDSLFTVNIVLYT